MGRSRRGRSQRVEVVEWDRGDNDDGEDNININDHELEEEDDDLEMEMQKKKSEGKTLPFYKLLSYADGVDWVLMGLGFLGAVVHGMAFPVGYLLLGKALNAFGNNINDQQEMVRALKKVYYTYMYNYQYQFLYFLSKIKAKLLQKKTVGVDMIRNICNVMVDIIVVTVGAGCSLCVVYGHRNISCWNTRYIYMLFLFL